MKMIQFRVEEVDPEVGANWVLPAPLSTWSFVRQSTEQGVDESFYIGRERIISASGKSFTILKFSCGSILVSVCRFFFNV